MRISQKYTETKKNNLRGLSPDHASGFFRQRVAKHGLTNIKYLKFAMIDQVETGKV